MAVYWRQNYDAAIGHHVEPSIEPLAGLELMRRGPVEAVMRAQDYVAAIGRRIIASGGIGGALTWRTPNSDPTSMAGTHPTPTARRRIGAGACELTPGSMLRCWGVVIPSGETQITGTTAGGAQGRLEVDVSWTDGTGTVTTTHGIELPASTEEFGAEPGSMWDELHQVVFGMKPTVLVNTATLRRWCQHVHVEVEIFAVGGARIVDACVFEVPNAVAFEADDNGSYWTSHMLGPGSPDGPTLPLRYPWQRFSETSPDGDPRGGTLHLLDVHHAQHTRLGPLLFSWSGHDEASGVEFASPASATWVAVDGGGSTSYDLTEPGLSAGTGGYARRVGSNGRHVLRNRRAAIPVIVRVLASSSTGVSEVRVQSYPWSFIDLTVANGGMAWHSIAGWLEVGITPDQLRPIQLFAQNTLGASVNVAAVNVYYAGGYAPPA